MVPERQGALGAVALMIAATAIIAEPAHAYLDAGTGSMIIQGIVAVCIGASLALRTYWRRIRNLFRRDSAQTPAAPSEE